VTRRIFVSVAIVLLGFIFASVALGYVEQHSLRSLAEGYVKLVPQELGAPNVMGVLLMQLAYPQFQPNIDFLSITESAAGALFVLAGTAGLIVAGGFLDNRILPLGQFGAFFSAGAIPVLSVLLGVKVGCELSVILHKFRP
jgi:hypothetical protein